MRWYHVVAVPVDRRTGKAKGAPVLMTREAVTHKEGMTIISKLTVHPGRDLRLQPVSWAPMRAKKSNLLG